MTWPIRTVLLALALALAVSLPVAAALAQGAEITVDMTRQDSGEPIEITSDTLRLDRVENTAIFEGDVVAVQGNLTLKADHVLVEYAPDPDSGKNEIERITATGNVVMLQAKPDQPGAKPDVAESGVAVYTVADAKVVMTEEVLLVQESTVLTGDMLTYHLDTGRGVMEGRVTTLLVPEGQ